MTGTNLVLDTHIRQALEETYQGMLVQGELSPMEQLQRYYSLFRSRFGPEHFMELDGESLLNTMHANGPENMVHWLEFKNDDEYPSGAFGGIFGGSALKYGIYLRKETGAWMTGNSLKQTELSTAQAIEIARKHREQLAAGAVDRQRSWDTFGGG
ncbi:MAG: hypothetical protein QGI09_06665 [Dehalococcoidia bacterium]|jgi:5-methylcytosine-specific restriction protein B|nr:hypothetical protein [Dehalococcoidia bacterium]|tara:strand:+ start:841 stop:1305 length:465 start_codon:yes stop_codon:yes gene_type:complete